MSEYMIMTDSTVDLPKEYLTEELGVPYIPLTYLIDGQSYEDMIGLTGEEFFAKVRAGSMPTTSQINPEQAREALEPYLKEKIFYILPFHPDLAERTTVCGWQQKSCRKSIRSGN